VVRRWSLAVAWRAVQLRQSIALDAAIQTLPFIALSRGGYAQIPPVATLSTCHSEP
jgi:hypothetical protein